MVPTKTHWDLSSQYRIVTYRPPGYEKLEQQTLLASLPPRALCSQEEDQPQPQVPCSFLTELASLRGLQVRAPKVGRTLESRMTSLTRQCVALRRNPKSKSSAQSFCEPACPASLRSTCASLTMSRATALVCFALFRTCSRLAGLTIIARI